MDIKLNFINHSNDANNSEVVIFAKNVATSVGETAVAWTVIQNCGQGDNHPFTYPMTTQVGASDSWGNFTPPQDAADGQQFSMVLESSGDVLRESGPAASPNEIEVLNNLPKGAINAGIYKSGKLYAQETTIAPQQKAVFQFKPTIWIGVASQVVQGEVMNTAIVSEINNEISLLGVASADIVMTGGGPGAESTPFQFSLQNVTFA
ncbi:aromatic ring-opening dioxygenase LigA [Caulobacter sp. Root655]|uniref:hypothetical protein n=1 Tax=Caulobacter sp. Root655 TaxID=1736578 RepID=UPI000701AF97|nr:hypothetical protein [Caulobacter sp. Root655]KRA56717.1 aromatic ring-opening dioxygenase LigA [Caulobacter sp. Root655]